MSYPVYIVPSDLHCSQINEQVKHNGLYCAENLVIIIIIIPEIIYKYKNNNDNITISLIYVRMLSCS